MLEKGLKIIKILWEKQMVQKGIVHPKMKILSLIIHPQVIPNP